jgi:hypothetical protein
MLKIIRNAILLNAFLSLIYVLSSVTIWYFIGTLTQQQFGSIWNPLYVQAYRFPSTPSPDISAVIWNLPFLAFWLMPIANLYFIIKVAREKSSGKNDLQKSRLSPS